MKKDITIPKVEGVFMAVVHEFNEIYKTMDWNAYLINENEVELELVLVVTSGFDKDKKTSTMRKKLDVLPAKSYAKIELIPEELLVLNNQFMVTFYKDNQLFEKTYLFRKNTINTNALQRIPLIEKEGVLVK